MEAITLEEYLFASRLKQFRATTFVNCKSRPNAHMPIFEFISRRIYIALWKCSLNQIKHSYSLSEGGKLFRIFEWNLSTLSTFFPFPFPFSTVLHFSEP